GRPVFRGRVLVDADALTEGPTDMNDPTNGTQAPPPTLSDAIQAHAQALLKANAMPNGMMAINPAQLYCDLELAQVRIEVLFEAGSAALWSPARRSAVAFEAFRALPSKSER